MSLYQISEDLKHLEEIVNDSDISFGEFVVEVAKKVEEGDETVQRMKYLIKNLDAEIQAKETEITDIQKRKVRQKAGVAAIKKTILYYMKVTSRKELGDFKIQKNGGKMPMILDKSDNELIAAGFFEKKVNTNALREMLENGELSEFAHLEERGESLRLK